MLYLSDSPLFPMKLIDKSEHLFYTEPHTGVGLHRPHRLVAKKREPFLLSGIAFNPDLRKAGKRHPLHPLGTPLSVR